LSHRYQEYIKSYVRKELRIRINQELAEILLLNLTHKLDWKKM